MAEGEDEEETKEPDDALCSDSGGANKWCASDMLRDSCINHHGWNPFQSPRRSMMDIETRNECPHTAVAGTTPESILPPPSLSLPALRRHVAHLRTNPRDRSRIVVNKQTPVEQCKQDLLERTEVSLVRLPMATGQCRDQQLAGPVSRTETERLILVTWCHALYDRTIQSQHQQPCCRPPRR